jgi:stage II sporulation protein D
VPVFILIGAPGCGKKERIPPYSPPPQVKIEKPISKAPGMVRILLAEGFDSVHIRGCRRSQRLDVVLKERELHLVPVTGESHKVREIGSGFRLEAAPGQFLELGGHRYRGAIEVFINPVEVPVVVNVLPVEDYLRGVVPIELGPVKYPQLEAQKAQAVAARTFALKNLGGNARFGFDLRSDQRSQAYLGMDSEYPLSDRGIRETRGVVALHRNELIWALYSSTCGGRTEAYHEIFEGGPIEYLRGGADCHDEASPYHSWEERIQIRKIQAKLDRYADVGGLKGLEPLRRSKAGRVVEMRFDGENGVKVLKGIDIRFALGLRSNFITAMKPIKDASGLVRELIVQGRGWGHGVGMCQVGAVELAARGVKYGDILKHYYNGIELSNYK